MATNTYWDTSKPIDGLLIPDIPGVFRNHVANTAGIIQREHATLGTGANTGGEHLNGAAVAYQDTSTPTNRPDGSTALASNAIDKGRLWLDDNFDPPVLKRWDGSAFEIVGTIAGGASPTQAFLISTTAEDSEGGRESQLRAKGTQSGSELTTLGLIEFSHSGAVDDQKGKMAIVLNDGDDSDTPSKKAIEFIDTGKIGVANSLAVLDEDDMTSDDAEVLATQQSIKAYADGTGTDFSGLDNDTSGFHVFAGGLILQWEKITGLSGASSGPIVITFGQAFTKCFNVVACIATNPKTSANIEVFSVAATQFQINKPTTVTAIRYIAIGR